MTAIRPPKLQCCLLFGLLLTGAYLSACSDDSTSSGDDGLDAGAGDAQPDSEPVVDACLGDEDQVALQVLDETPDAAPSAILWCSLEECLLCVSDPECDAGRCVELCVSNYEDGTADDPEVDEHLRTLRDSGLSGPCLGCFAGITSCVVSRGCAFGAGCAQDGTSCECQQCQCDEGCATDFATCSGLNPHLECDALTEPNDEPCSDG